MTRAEGQRVFGPYGGTCLNPYNFYFNPFFVFSTTRKTTWPRSRCYYISLYKIKERKNFCIIEEAIEDVAPQSL